MFFIPYCHELLFAIYVLQGVQELLHLCKEESTRFIRFIFWIIQVHAQCMFAKTPDSIHIVSTV